jgi:hypothetical protein
VHHVKTFVLAAVLLLTALPAASAHAQRRIGSTEVGFSFSIDDLTDERTLDASLRLAHYVGEQIELGAEVRGMGKYDEIADRLFLQLFALYDFSPSTLGDTFYARAGYFTVAESVGDGVATVGLGYKTYLRDDTALYWETTYAVLGFGDGPFSDSGVVGSTTGLVCTF